jgi:sigma-B regulation protein RsbU (phosphoserine phosphatase)
MQDALLASLQLIDGAYRQQIAILHSPFTIGRLPDRDLVLDSQLVSRNHAAIVEEADGIFLIDHGSRHGSFVNGERVERHRLKAGDSIHFGSLVGPLIRVGGLETQDTARALLEDLRAIAQPSTDIEKLSWFLDAARKLNQVGGVDEILTSLLDVTLQLTQSERGFVFLIKDDGELRLASGRSCDGYPLLDDGTISRTAIHQAIQSASAFVVTDTLLAEPELQYESMVAKNIRNVICFPLRRRAVESGSRDGDREIQGVLYLDSRLQPGKMTLVDNELLETIATGAAALVENASLAQAELAARQYREELNIAARIQQELMAVQVPELPFARVEARSVPCKEVGGDFYDVIAAEDALYVTIADISGKGISAAILASTLQGLIYSQMLSGQPLEKIALMVNRYLCTRDVGKYATLVLLKLTPDGVVEYLNCGHVQPLLVGDGAVRQLHAGNLIVGIIPDASYESHSLRMSPGERLILTTDGITEAEDRAGEPFGETRLAEAAREQTLDEILARVQHFTSGVPFNDDCTMIEICYKFCD